MRQRDDIDCDGPTSVVFEMAGSSHTVELRGTSGGIVTFGSSPLATVKLKCAAAIAFFVRQDERGLWIVPVDAGTRVGAMASRRGEPIPLSHEVYVEVDGERLSLSMLDSARTGPRTAVSEVMNLAPLVTELNATPRASLSRAVSGDACEATSDGWSCFILRFVTYRLAQLGMLTKSHPFGVAAGAALGACVLTMILVVAAQLLAVR